MSVLSASRPRRAEFDTLPTDGRGDSGGRRMCVGIQVRPMCGGRNCVKIREHWSSDFERTDQLSQIGGCRTEFCNVRMVESRRLMKSLNQQVWPVHIDTCAFAFD